MFLTATVIALLSVFLVVDVRGQLAPEYDLVQWRLKNYPPSKGGRPVHHLADTVNVTLTFQLLHMNELNDVDQTMSVLAMLRIQWNDPFLAWSDHTEYQHIDQVTVKPNAIWTPRILHLNNVADQQVVMRFGERSEVTVGRDGEATWEPTGILVSNCKLILAKFPFDKQTCEIAFDSWLRAPLVVFVNADYAEQSSDVFGPGSVWAPVSYSQELSGCETYCQSKFSITMRRNIQYFLYNIIIPCILLSVLQLATFCLNPEAPDRPAYSVSVLVAFGIFQIMIQEQIPKTSEMVFLLLYIVIQFAIGTASTMISAIFCYVIAVKVALVGHSVSAAEKFDVATDKAAIAKTTKEQSVLSVVRRIDTVAFIILFAATGVSHGVIFFYISI